MKLLNPPINELVIGVYFDQPITSLRGEHVGLFWSSVRKHFPIIEQQPPVAAQQPGMPLALPELLDAPNEVFPMPRYWLSSADGVNLIQVQRNALLFNWRKRDSAYPHYEEVKRAFDNSFASFSAFLVAELNASPPVPRLCELAYVNLITPSPLWSGLDDTSKVLPGFSIPQVDPANERDFLQISAYRVSAELWITVSVKSGTRVAEGDKVLVIELKAAGLPASSGDTDAWFETAHSQIRKTFLAITSEEAQRWWQQPI